LGDDIGLASKYYINYLFVQIEPRSKPYLDGTHIVKLISSRVKDQQNQVFP